MYVPQYVVINRHVNSCNPQLFPTTMPCAKRRMNFLLQQSLVSYQNIANHAHDDLNNMMIMVYFEVYLLHFYFELETYLKLELIIIIVFHRRIFKSVINEYNYVMNNHDQRITGIIKDYFWLFL